MSADLVACDPWWEYARGCAAALRVGAPAPSIAVYGPILNHDEHAQLCTTAISSRLVAGDGSYQRSSSFVLGSPWLNREPGVLACSRTDFSSTSQSPPNGGLDST